MRSPHLVALLWSLLPTAVAHRTATAHPMPTFGEGEMGLMTRDEFLTARNPEGKYHPSDAYETNLAGRNYSGGFLGEARGRSGETYSFSDPGGEGLVVEVGDKVVAVIYHDTLYHDRKHPASMIPLYYTTTQYGAEPVDLRDRVKRTKEVKYLSDLLVKVNALVKRNRARFPVLLQRLMVKGEPLEIRAESEPEKDKGVTLAILNGTGEEIASASNEWGATLIAVVGEYRGRGLGRILGRIWYEQNPGFESGGFTSSGEENALRIWQGRVQEFLANGWYTALIANHTLTVQRVRDILKGLSDRSRHDPLPLPTPGQSGKGRLNPKDALVLVEEPTFIVYDPAFLTDPDDKYILGYGFFRNSSPAGTFFYTLDYVPGYEKFVTYVGLQMARDMGDTVYVGPGYGDHVDYEGLAHVEILDPTHIALTRDVLPLADMGRLEALRRKPHDRYGQLHDQLYELAEGKWS